MMHPSSLARHPSKWDDACFYLFFLETRVQFYHPSQHPSHHPTIILGIFGEEAFPGDCRPIVILSASYQNGSVIAYKNKSIASTLPESYQLG